jgi:hypothetical protein
MKIQRFCDDDAYSIPGFFAIKAIQEKEAKKRKISEFKKMVKEFFKIYGNFLTDWRKKKNE